MTLGVLLEAPGNPERPVMLVIAGGVSAVLLTRGGEAISNLEAQSVGTVTASNCTSIELRTTDGGSIDGTLHTATTPNECRRVETNASCMPPGRTLVPNLHCAPADKCHADSAERRDWAQR